MLVQIFDLLKKQKYYTLILIITSLTFTVIDQELISKDYPSMIFSKEFLSEISFKDYYIFPNFKMNAKEHSGDIFQTHGYIGLFIYLILPDLYLIVFTNIKMALFDLVVILYSAPVATMYYSLVRYGLQNRHPNLMILLFLRCALELVIYILQNKRIREEVQTEFENQRIRQTRGNIDRLERILNSIGTMANLNEMSSKLEKLQHFFTMLQDTSKIKQFNLIQLLTAQKDLYSTLDSINYELSERNSNNSKEYSTPPMKSEKCVICYECSNPNILFSPCNHQCICEDCLNEMLGSDSLSHCFLCKIPIISWEISKKNHLIIQWNNYFNFKIM
eukprot:gene10103-2523_t